MAQQQATIVMELEPQHSSSERLILLLRSLRALAMQHPGFDGSMIWFSDVKSRQLLVLSYWSTLDAWERFRKAAETTEVLSGVAALLSGPLKERHFIRPNGWDQFPGLR